MPGLTATPTLLAGRLRWTGLGLARPPGSGRAGGAGLMLSRFRLLEPRYPSRRSRCDGVRGQGRLGCLSGEPGAHEGGR